MLDQIKDELKKLQAKSAALGTVLNIEDQKKQLASIEEQAADPNLWSDNERAKKILQDKKIKEKIIASFEELKNGVEEIATMVEMAQESDLTDLHKELLELDTKADKLELSALMSGEYAKSNAILSINSGAGGTDAQDWAQILMRMYTRWAESHEFGIDMPEISYGEEAGIKGVTLIITGPYAYGYLKNESGIHRLVRISPFSSEGKRHTSFVAVEVIPEIADEVKIEINPSDLKVDTYRASGPGGQNVNKVSSAIRITHIPTGIVTQSQSDRSQHNNRDTAMRLLKAKLNEMMQEQQKDKIDELRGEKKKIEWGHQIRSYVFQPYTLVKDHRTGAEVGDVQRVIDGDIDPFIEASLRTGKK
ncbi:MAG: peptide chain release factor 2 [Candidatus Margulisiibacteriota bacterium]